MRETCQLDARENLVLLRTHFILLMINVYLFVWLIKSLIWGKCQNNFLKICITYLLLAALGLRCCTGFSLVEASGRVLASVQRPLTVAAGPALNLGLGHAGCSDCSFLAPELGSAAAAWSLVAAWFVGSSRTRDQTWVSCVGRWILYHWAIKEALKIMLIFFFFPSKCFFFPYCSPRTHFVWIFLTFTGFTILRFVLLSILFSA